MSSSCIIEIKLFKVSIRGGHVFGKASSALKSRQIFLFQKPIQFFATHLFKKKKKYYYTPSDF